MADFFTFLRLFGAFIIPFFIIIDFPRAIPFSLYVFFALTDILDGVISRRGRKASDGDIFDPVADKALFISALVSLIYVQKIPLFASVFIILREIVVLGVRASAERFDAHIPSSFLAKLKTFAGNFSVGAYILKHEYFGISATFVGDVSLLICFILSFISGADYITKYIRLRRGLGH